MIFVLCLEFEYVYLFRSYDDVVALCACFLASFLFVFCVFSLFILSTLNKYHEKFQRSLTSNRKISAKRKQIARNWTGKCLTNFKPNQARLAVSSDELRTHFLNDYWIILDKFAIAVRIKRVLNINIGLEYRKVTPITRTSHKRVR